MYGEFTIVVARPAPFDSSACAWGNERMRPILVMVSLVKQSTGGARPVRYDAAL